MESFRATLQTRMDLFFSRFYIRFNNILMNKKIEKNNIEEIKKQTLRNILSSKGIIYRYYLRSLQQQHQSYRCDYLPIEQLK